MSLLAPELEAPSPPSSSPRRHAGALRADLRASVLDAAAFAVMVGIGETYVPAFVLALGHGPVLAGLVASLPMLAGAVLQLASPHAVRALGSHRRWVVLCAAVQAVCFVPYLVGALRGALGAAAVFTTASLYWAGGQGTGPAWNTWMERLVPRRLRARYFARRNRVAQLATLAGLVAGGYLLEAGYASGHALRAFALVFGVAAVARLASVRALTRQSEPPTLEIEKQVPVTSFARRLWNGQDGRLVLYMMAMQTAVYVAGPYFNPFMLGQLRLSYTGYVGLVAAAYLARIAALPLLGRWAERYGARWLLWVGGIGVIPMAAIWIVSGRYTYLVAIQVLSGAVWAAYELATQLLFFEMIRRDERTSVLTYYNLVNATAIVVGALGGAALLGAVGGRTGYLVIFAVSSAGRLLTVGLLRRVAVTPRRLTRVVTRILAVRPTEGAFAPPVIPSIEERPVASHGAQRAGDAAPGPEGSVIRLVDGTR